MEIENLLSKKSVKVPVKFFIERLRYVSSKSWSLILSRIVVRNLFPSDRHNDLLVKVVDKVFLTPFHKVNTLFTLSFDSLNLQATYFHDYDKPAPASSFYHRFVGSVNGIVILARCLSFRSGFHMWNPPTGTYQKAPICITPHPDPYTCGLPFHINFHPESLGCGFCAESQSIKVVSIRKYDYYYTPPIPDFFHDDAHRWRYEMGLIPQGPIPVRDINLLPDYIIDVYRLSTESWKPVVVDTQLFSQFPPLRSSFYPQRGYSNNATYSWLVITHDVGEPPVVKLLTFHLTTEAFQVTSVPDAVLGDSDYYSRSGGIDGRSPFQLSNGTIALVVPSLDRTTFGIWLLLEYGNSDSWTRLCTIGPFPEINQLLGFWKNGKVFLESTSGELLLADLFTNKITQSLQIEGSPCLSQIILHKDTHIVLKGDPLDLFGTAPMHPYEIPPIPNETASIN